MRQLLKIQLFGLFCILLAANAQAQADSWEWLYKIDNKYQNVHLVTEDIIAVSTETEGDWQLINGKGELINPIYFHGIPALSGNLIVFQDSSLLYGAMDKNGKLVIKPEFAYALSFENGRALTANQQGYLYIDSLGRKVPEGKTGFVRAFAENKGIKWEGERCYFIDTAGNKLFGKQDFQNAKAFSEGLAAVQNNELWAFINDKGEFISKFEFEEAISFFNGAAVVRQNNKAGLIDKKGAWIIQPIYYTMWSMSNGYFGVSDHNNNQWIVDNKGKKSSKQLYKRLVAYSNGLFHCQIGDKYHICDHKGNILVEEVNAFVADFEGFIWTIKKDKYALIDNKGQLLGGKWYDFISPLTNGLAAVQDNGKYGLINREAKLLIPYIFEDLIVEHNGSIWARMGDTQGFIKLK